jgi:hypothetical protein
MAAQIINRSSAQSPETANAINRRMVSSLLLVLDAARRREIQRLPGLQYCCECNIFASKEKETAI